MRMKNNYISHLHFISKHLFTLLVLGLLFIGVESVSATTYYSAGNNVPNTRTNWWTNTNGTGTNPANFTTAGNTFVIQSGHTMTTNANWTVSGAGSTIQINTGGTLVASNTVTSTVMTVASGGTYQHNTNGGTIPTATWNAGSNCTITGITTATSLAGLGQTFGNFTWNCASQTTNLYLESNITVAGNFSVLSTGTLDANNHTLRMSNTANAYAISVNKDVNIATNSTFKMNNSTGSCTMNIDGNLTINNGANFVIVTGNANSTVNVTGAVNIAGTLSMQEEGSMTGTLNVKGNFSLTGTVIESATGIGAINFNGTTTQTYSKTGTISNIINFAVNSGSTLDVGTSIINGDGTFTLNSGANIITAHTQGLSTSAATGSIQVTGTRTYSTGANYTYNAAGAQDIGNGVTGANNLTLSGSGIKTLSGNISISNNLTVSAGATLATDIYLITGNVTGTMSMGAGTNLILGRSGYYTANTHLFPSLFASANISLNATSNVIFQGQSYGYIPGITYGNLTIASGNNQDEDAEGNITVNGNLTVNANSHLRLGWTLTALNVMQQLIINGELDFVDGSSNPFASASKTVNITGNLSGTGTINMTQAIHTFNLNGSNNSITTFNTDANNGTVTYGYAGNQQIFASPNYKNLTLSGSGTKTFAGTTNISNTFTNNNVIANLGAGLTHATNTYYLGGTQQAIGSWGGTGSGATNTNPTNFAAATGILNVAAGCAAGYWKGTTSQDWNIASNWCDGTVPTSATNVTIPASAPNQPVIGAAGGLCNDITIGTGASLTLNVVTNLFINGNWANNGTFSASGIGSVIFSGTASQSIGGSTSTSFYNLTIQNSGAVGSNLVTLNKPTTVTGVLLLVDGNLVTNATNLISVTKTSNSAIMGGSSSSFIDGPVIWSLPAGLTTGTTYNFPVGDNTAYLPFTLVNPSTSAGTTALVKAFNANSGGTGNGISTTEYWQLTTAPGFTNSSVSLGKGSNTVYPYDLILGNTAKAGAYTSLGGTTGFYDITNSSAIGANSFFALGTSATPKINFVPVILGGFFYIYNFGPSNEQTFILNGTSLTEGITVSAPTHFEISLTSGTGFAPSIVLPIVSGNKVNTTPIYIRLKSGLAIGTYSSEKVTMVSTGATTKEITCEGTVFATTPTIITTGGRNCPPNNTQIQLGSSGDNINILYWTGPNNYYSQSPNPFISPANATYDGTYTVTGSLPTGGNLINNGDFELQNVGFSSSYAFVDSTSVPTSTCYNFILGCEGTYTVLKSPKSVHGNFLPVPDHSNPGTFQMVINGATTANVSVWSQTVKVIPNSTYQFSYWLQSVNLENPSKLQLYANNQPVGTIFTASSAAGWNQYFYNWNSGSNTDVVLDLRNQNIVPNGNDFALDDIIFRTVTQVSSSINVTSTNVVAVSITTPTTTVTTGTNVTFSATPTNGGTSPDYVWTVTNGASSTSYPVTKSSSFSYVPTAGDVVSCVMTSNSTCITGNPATSNAITMIVNGNKNLWIGAPGIGGTVWSDKANWTATKVPASGDNVEFATTGNNSGVAAKNDLYVDYNRIVGNIINNASGKNLIIPADKEVVVNNLITLTPVNTSSTYDQIQIKCDPNPIDASRLPNGSIIFKNASNVNGTVEMYSKSYIDNSATDDTQKYFWQYFGIPVETTTAEPTLYGAYVRKSNEAGDETDANYYWTELNNASVLNAFDGYEICQPTKTTYTFTGQLVNRSLNQPTLPYSTGVDVKYRGENLLANPYTAAIDVNKINFGTNVEAAVYLYNTGSYGQWNAATTLGNNPGQYICIPKLPAGNNGLPQEVPSMSSMLVKATAVSNGGISFNYNDVIKKNETIQRVKSVDAISSTDLISTMIDLTGQHYSDRMWIFTEPSCTRNFDNGWDGRKILGSSLAPQIYAIEPDGDYQVNSVSDMYNTDLAFQAGDEVEYTLKFTHQNIQQRYAGVYLVDLIENKTVDVTQSGSTYTFATAQSDTPAKRFKILTRSYEKDAPDTEAQVKIFTAPGRVFVHNLTTFKGECTLYDIAGRAIKNASFAANAVTEVLSNLTPGAYVINTITNGEKLSKRVIVQ
jgi:hypothetical protein